MREKTRRRRANRGPGSLCCLQRFQYNLRYRSLTQELRNLTHQTTGDIIYRTQSMSFSPERSVILSVCDDTTC